MKNKKRLNSKQLFYFVFIVLFTGLFVFFIRRNLHSIKDSLRMRWDFLAYLVLLNFSNKFFVGLKTRKIVGVFKIKLSFLEWFGSSIIGNFYNYFFPKGGTAIMAVYFKNRHKLNYHKYIAILVATVLVTVLTCGLLGLAATLFLASKKFLHPAFFIIIFSGMILGPIIFALIPNMRLPGFLKKDKITKLLEGIVLLRNSTGMIAYLSLMDAGIILGIAVRYFIFFKMFSLNVSLLNCILISPFSILMHFGTLIPGGYGIKEAVVGFVSKLTNIGFSAGVLATLSDRVLFMALSFILGGIYSLILFKHIFLKQEDLENAKI
ncbi:MAG: flippase-like domain-containing protein [Candidatus Omnitrophica bacterium]|nr:flippase-like domain-containing protein [Candidatus Omnitrophota bacterium]